MSDNGARIERLSPRRRGTVDYMRTAGQRSNVHGLVEIDVTEARQRLQTIEAETGESLSFTAFVVSCLARSIDDHPRVNAYRDWRGRVHVFDDVDVNVLIETTVQGERMGVPHVLRGANHRSVRSIHDEIRTAQESPDPTELPRMGQLALRLPGVVRRLVWRLPQWFPRRWKTMAGTVAVTSVGMFGQGGGWAVAPTNYTLQLTIGGISRKPRMSDGAVTTRAVLDLTVTFDHDVVDGAPAARFVQRLRELIENAHGLRS
ncbi:2-oxo acid dehydrogenase subunit E2 [Natrinema salaciae]|uniref:2-oxoacid dehydrogenases acyltransferase (Catalytic domain) n=1 Tax=Natrinema salaciae TaxID=1186196 RepID=A0A1H9SST4_9EURY|nr:2-oxo acid dehydrogenase subunit E2 [Natrinema salaciae]SER88016.1 2-oxoacid dehydrogenases acyltransferase (catalytic domain) [Natrinema salaciae]